MSHEMWVTVSVKGDHLHFSIEEGEHQVIDAVQVRVPRTQLTRWKAALAEYAKVQAELQELVENQDRELLPRVKNQADYTDLRHTIKGPS
jgi:hypothetical protein